MGQFSKSLYVVGLVLFGVLLWRLASLYGVQPVPAESDPESARLFQALKLQMMADGRVSLPAQDADLAAYRDCLAQQGRDCDQQRAALKRGLRALYATPNGQRVQQEVAAWNHTRRFAAIRDNLPEHTDENWVVSEALPTRDLVPLSFGYVNGESVPSGFNNWVSVSSEADQVTFCRTFQLKQAIELHVQVVGKPLLQGVAGVSAYIARSDEKSNNESAAAFTLSLPKGNSHVCLPVALFVADNVTKDSTIKVDGLLLSLQNGQARWASSVMSASAVENAGGDFARSSFQVLTRDGEPLTLAASGVPAGQASVFTFQNGLLNLLGEDASNASTLSGLLARSHLPENAKIHLTLDKRWQSLAQRWLNTKSQTNSHSELPPRGVLVVLNPNSGAILAAASTPGTPRNVHPWDRAAFSRLHPNADPFQFLPWQLTTTDFTPGSSFKLVSALTALQASATDPALEKFLGGIPLKDAAKFLKMKANDGPWEYKGVVVQNDTPGETLKMLGDKAGLSAALKVSLNTWFAALAVRQDEKHLSGSDAQQTDLLKMAQQLGFCEPLDLFAAAPAMRRYPARLGERETKAGELTTKVWGGDVLNALPSPMNLDLQAGKNTPNNSTLWLNRLMHSAHGYQMSATPLQMARVAATVATGKKVMPHLLLQWNGKAVNYPDAKALDVPHLDWLKMGMKQVVTEKGGTAYRIFEREKLLRQRVYGKTGTADTCLPKKAQNGCVETNSGWFIGWLTDEHDKPAIAFACVLTQIGGKHGGETCGELVKNMLKEAIDQEYQP